MTPAAAAHEIERPASLFGPPPTRERASEQTLEQLMSGTWTELRRRAAAACPMCGGTLQARWGAGPAPVAGRCNDCGTELT
ncbi:MAG: hypothetical protein JHC95_11055 [Solirubrobacteraceae bacterium]|nr:hypothetical protein [Solirubrobacteraceae bacterium]